MTLLLRLEARRLAGVLRHPRPGTWAANLAIAALAAGGLWTAGESARPDVALGDTRMLLGILVSSPAALVAYPVLFRADDEALLRSLGIPARAVFGVRALRLLGVALASALLAMLPYLSTGAGPPLAVALAAAVLSCAASLYSFCGAASRLATPGFRPGLLSATIGWDPELRAAAPAVFAPIGPVLAGALAAAALPYRPLPVILVSLALSAVFTLAAARRFERARPRFAAQAAEMAFAPAPETGSTELVVDRGLARLLPRRAGAVRARDAVVVARRFRWAGRLVAPVAVVAVLALLRAGARPEVRGWVAAACALLLGAQALAVVALGRLERRRGRWIDRSLGVAWADRLLGRWALGFGLALGVVLPVAIAWRIAVPGPAPVLWLAAAAGGALAAALASLAAAGR